MKKFMLAFMAVACVAAFTTTAKADESAAPATKTEAPAKVEAKKVKHHGAKHHKVKKAEEVKTEAKADETVKAPENK